MILSEPKDMGKYTKEDIKAIFSNPLIPKPRVAWINRRLPRFPALTFSLYIS